LTCEEDYLSQTSLSISSMFTLLIALRISLDAILSIILRMIMFCSQTVSQPGDRVADKEGCCCWELCHIYEADLSVDCAFSVFHDSSMSDVDLFE